MDDKEMAAARAKVIPDTVKLLALADALAEDAEAILESDGGTLECINLARSIDAYTTERNKNAQ